MIAIPRMFHGWMGFGGYCLLMNGLAAMVWCIFDDGLGMRTQVAAPEIGNKGLGMDGWTELGRKERGRA